MIFRVTTELSLAAPFEDEPLDLLDFGLETGTTSGEDEVEPWSIGFKGGKLIEAGALISLNGFNLICSDELRSGLEVVVTCEDPKSCVS